MLTKGNVKIGQEWRFGTDWPGQRCGAKTRKGTECQRPANKKNGRCRLHGGASTGANTSEGRDRLRAVQCPSDIIDQIGGWSTAGVGQAYGEGYSLEKKWE